MPRRSILTKRQQARLLDLPTDAASLHKHYTLDNFDLEQIRGRRRAQNKMGFALQLCALRYPGRLLAPGEVIPVEVLRFLADQIGVDAGDLAGYATREETRRDHLMILRNVYGFKTLPGGVLRNYGSGYWIRLSMHLPILIWPNGLSADAAKPKPSCLGSARLNVSAQKCL